MNLYPPATNSNKNLEDRLIAHEGMKRFAYKDTKGYITAGIGRCLETGIGKGLTVEECLYLLRNDIEDFRQQLSVHNWFTIQDTVRQDALVELAFNMGTANLLKFKRTIAALIKKDYVVASAELFDSLWATQVGKNRVADIRKRIETGRY